jgi:hypothetical protein
LAQRIYPKEDGSLDTVLQTAIHCEWESGLASGNASNPLAAEMRAGNSSGFLTAGHRRGERLWTMPTIGDWVHLEGLWIWDRGHPPARTEIHPIRFMAIVRNLPDFIHDGAQDSVFATRTDIFGSGDGGAVMNNRPGQPDFVHHTRMAGRTYTFKVLPRLPQPTAESNLKWRWITQAADDFKGPMTVLPTIDLTGNMALRVTIDWTSVSDTTIFARTLYAWWDTPLGKAADTHIHTYAVDLHSLEILMRKDGLSRSEWRFFTDVGGHWLFQNEFLAGEDVLADGLAHTYKRKWPLSQRIMVHVPDGVAFRVFAGGWEADGMDKCFGEILNPEAPCTPTTLKALRRHLLPATPLGLGGCLDDLLGVAHAFPNPATLQEGGDFKIFSTGHPETYDYCPGKSGIQENCFSFRYSVRRLSTR